jgi:DNA-binding XRE family transcriptional regulator
MSSKKLTSEQKKAWAKMLYTREQITNQKELSETVGVSQQTMSKWVNNENWEQYRKNVLLTREEQLLKLLNELDQINAYIEKKPEGARFADNKEADIRRKLIRDIKDLETKASLAEIIETAKRFTRWLSPVNLQKAKEVSALFDDFIKDCLR